MVPTDFKNESFEGHKEDLLESSNNTKFIVFLCGPTIEGIDKHSTVKKHGAAKILRANIKKSLENDGFDVVLGEDDGLEDTRLNMGLDAQNNELEYISKYCDAVIVVTANSAIGAFCELGLFSWHFTHPDGKLNNKVPGMDFILLVEKKYKGKKSYFNEGPAKVVKAFGLTSYIDFKNYNVKEIIDRLKLRKSITSKDSRGRPRSKK